jgi:hypothetical protein
MSRSIRRSYETFNDERSCMNYTPARAFDPARHRRSIMSLAAAFLAVLAAPDSSSSASAPSSIAMDSPASVAAPAYTLLEILNAIRVVETRGTPNSGRDTGGDSGRAIGPFQIHYAYWKDAGLPGSYEDCRDMDYARRVVLAYWRRYCPKALAEHDPEVLARTHNGGPAGAKHGSTLPFWKKVRAELERVSKDSKTEKDPAKTPASDAKTRHSGTEIARAPAAFTGRSAMI